MSTVEETIDIAVPVSTAYNQWTQFKSFPRFMTAVRSVEQIRPNLTRWVIGSGPLRYEFDAEIVEQVPDSLVAWRASAGVSATAARCRSTRPLRAAPRSPYGSVSGRTA